MNSDLLSHFITPAYHQANVLWGLANIVSVWGPMFISPIFMAGLCVAIQ